MKPNVGGIDRIVRIAAGVILLALTLTGTIGWWGWLGIVSLVTGLVRWCPIWAALGVNTASAEKAPDA